MQSYYQDYPIQSDFIHVVDISKWIILYSRANLCEIDFQLLKINLVCLTVSLPSRDAVSRLECVKPA
jgi:hypothetical protein